MRKKGEIHLFLSAYQGKGKRASLKRFSLENPW